jgi:hypothetical protein
MAAKPVPKIKLQEAVDAVRTHGSVAAAAKALKINRGTLINRLNAAALKNIVASVTIPDKIDSLKVEVKSLQTQLKAAEKERLSTAYVRKFIFDLADTQLKLPNWLIHPKKNKAGYPGVPCMMWSDWHWGEVVNKSEMNGINEYDMKIARERARQLFQTTVDLLKNYTVNPVYPGVVVNLGGDMVTGDIHEELTNTNDMPIMPTVIDLFGILVEGIQLMANQFGNVFVPCVTGNHGRNTKKIQHKQRAYTSFDWLIYQLLEKHFINDKRITFFIPDAPDASYKVYNHRYLLTHGDQFRGGDGIIGPIGPIMRGDNKKRSRNSQMGMDYDTMIIGHFHTLMMLPRLIVNGSLIGYNEYAFSGNFPFEPPAQALWMTHPDLGMTISMPIYTDRNTKRTVKTNQWVSVPTK